MGSREYIVHLDKLLWKLILVQKKKLKGRNVIIGILFNVTVVLDSDTGVKLVLSLT